MKQTINILFFVILFSGGLWAQTDTHTQILRGTVSDADTHLPIEGANVVLSIDGSQEVKLSDSEGEFSFENVPVGRHDLSVILMGYNPVRLNQIIVGSGRQTVLDIKMQINVIETEEVVITAGSRSEVSNEMASVSARTFSVEDTERYAGSLGDPSRMAANFAGVMSVSDQRNDIIIRGNSPLGLLWRLEGIEIPNPNHFGAYGTTGGPVSMLNNNLLANSDFYTGAFPAEFGNALAGVFDLKMRRGNHQKREHIAQVGFNGFELGTEGPFVKDGKASYLANFRYSTMEIFNMLGMDMGTGVAVPQYKDLTFHLNFPLKKGRLSLIGLGGNSYIELLHNDEDDALSYDAVGADTYFGSETGVVGLSHVHYLSEQTRWHNTVSAQSIRSFTQLDSIADDNSRYLFYNNDFRENKFSFSSKLAHRFNRKNTAILGVRTHLFQNNLHDSVKVLEEDRFQTITDAESNFMLTQAFAEWKHRFTENFDIYAGTHFSHFSLNNSTALEPRAGLNWNFLPAHSLNLGVGMHSQLPVHNAFFLQTEQDNGSIILANQDLGFMKSKQIVLGYGLRPAPNFRVKTELYYQELTDIPIGESHTWYSMVNEGAGFGVGMLSEMKNSGTAENYGVELTIEKFFSNNYYFLMTSSLYESKYIDYNGIERNTVFNGNYVFNALGGYEFKTGANSVLAADLRGVWAGGQRIMPIDLEASREAGEPVYLFDQAFENRYDDYIKFDLRITFRLNNEKNSHEWALDIQNFTNNKNIFRESYDPVTGELHTDYQTGLYPMMLYRFRF